MSALNQVFIAGMKGLQKNKKPVFLQNEAWQKMDNAYVWRERIRKRQGLLSLGRLQRDLTGQSLGNTAAGPPNTVTITDIFTTLTLRATEPKAELQPGSLVITVDAPDDATFTDQGDGTFAVTGAGVASGSYVNYSTGNIVLQFTSLTGGGAISGDFSYYPTLPGMGIWQRDQATINDWQTIWFDQKYAYVRQTSSFEEFIPGTTWNGDDSDFFWAYNYRGSSAATRLFFVTNANLTTSGGDPMRYTDGTTWTSFAPLITATDTLFGAKILVAYYGRLLALNTYEGTTAGGRGGAVNFFNRCRGSQLGDPTDQTNAWRTDVFGRGFFLDAPTNESIISAIFIKNTLVVKFEQTTWQLRYVGEYGLPFIWERVSADYGSDSTFANILFDNYMLNVGDKAVTSSDALGAQRIDLEIPDQVFDIQNANFGRERVWGVRDYQRELAFWNFPDANTESVPGVALTFPNKVLVYNYRDPSYAIFRDSVTCFGIYETPDSINWNSTDITWDDENVTWSDSDVQEEFPLVVGLNQQGFAFGYGYTTPDEMSLSIQGVDLTQTPIQITVPNHNLLTGETVYLQGMLFLNDTTFEPITSDLNDTIYQVQVVDANTLQLLYYDFDLGEYVNNFTYSFTPSLGPGQSALYVGGGTLALFPKLDIQSKDFNPYQDKGMKTKLAKVGFLMYASTSAAMTVQVYINSSPSVIGNMTVGQTQVSTVPTEPYYPPGSDYAWFMFYSPCQGQYFNLNLTYDDALMNTMETHEQDWILYAMNAFVKPGGKIV